MAAARDAFLRQLDYITSHYITLHHIASHYITLHYNTLHRIISHIILHCISLPCTAAARPPPPSARTAARGRTTATARRCRGRTRPRRRRGAHRRRAQREQREQRFATVSLLLPKTILMRGVRETSHEAPQRAASKRVGALSAAVRSFEASLSVCGTFAPITSNLTQRSKGLLNFKWQLQYDRPRGGARGAGR